MTDVCVNPLSADGQHYTNLQIESGVSNLIRCFRYILPALEAGRARLIYDDSIEARSLIAGGDGLLSEINGLSNGDLRRQWFLYTKNRARRVTSEQHVVRVSSRAIEAHMDGALRPEFVAHDAVWLSFSGKALTDQNELDVTGVIVGPMPITIMNRTDLEGFRRLWPLYRASAKHRKEGYFREGGEWVSPMPLDETLAQEVLMASVQFENDLFGRSNGRYYRFVRTHLDQKIYHGFSVEAEEVPDEAVIQLGKA